MSGFTSDRFPEFFQALYARAPYPWQTRLTSRVADSVPGSRPWPDVIALPTGTGKTACVDIAVFALACQAGRPPVERTAPRRVFFVIDRRVVVDQAHERAAAIADRLKAAEAGILREVADRLRLIAGGSDSDPLATVQLRGGMYRESRWLRSLAQPTVIATTVDQVGSRLLFRGYGVSSTQHALHAGILANDSLFILDEAHCSLPFKETLAAVSRYRSQSAQALDLPPFHTVSLTATPRMEPKEEVFALDDSDEADQELRRRLGAVKKVRLQVAAKAKGPRFHAPLAEELASEARRLSDGGAIATAVVVNRVQTAGLVFARLQDAGADVVLMTGRMRPVDRDFTTAEIARRFHTRERPFFVVATQCLEVGVDYDFDAMVSECASLDALRQRFGRLNRAGRLNPTHGVILVRNDQQDAGDDEDSDPVYGNALPRTWRWLKELASDGIVDFGTSAFAARAGGTIPQDLTVEVGHAPVMLPSHLDAWVQTEPAPRPSPDVALFLHGPDRIERDVHVCWRGDLMLDPDGRLPERAWRDALSLCQPSLAECLPVPIGLFSKWLKNGRATLDVADVEGAAARGEDDETTPLPQEAKRELALVRWRGDRSDFLRNDASVAPGDVIVVPAFFGGWESLGYLPSPWNTPVSVDRGERAIADSRRRKILRLHPQLLGRWPTTETVVRLKEMVGEHADDVALIDRGELADLLAQTRQELADVTDPVVEDLRHVLEDFVISRIVPHPLGGIVLVGQPIASASEITDEDDFTSISAESGLHEHCADVANHVRSMAMLCGISSAVMVDLELAARAHDLGKADERFQAWLHGGSRVMAAACERLLAKSVMITPSARHAARRQSGYPAAARHEALSVRLIESSAELVAMAADPDLFLHLVASHHGYCRPLAPVVKDSVTGRTSVDALGFALSTNSAAALERLDSGAPERFWRVVRRYGWWGVAWLEAQLRLADWRVSELEEARQEARGQRSVEDAVTA